MNKGTSLLSAMANLSRRCMGRGGCFVLFVLLFAFVLPACEEYNTYTVGTKFEPLNPLVSRFVHFVNVKFSEGDVSIWGPYVDLIKVEKDSARITITSQDDSLALIVYGDAVGDSLHHYHGQLRILIEQDFALYLTGLHLYSIDGPAIEVQGEESTCYMVLGKGSDNVLSDTLYHTQYVDGFIQEADACLYVAGTLYLDGTGKLTVHNRALPRYDADWGDTVYTHALYACGGLYCNYGASVNLHSKYGDAIHTSTTEVKMVRGTWNLYPGRDTINTETSTSFKVDYMKIDSTRIEILQLDTLRLDSLKVDSIRVDSIIIDSLKIDTTYLYRLNNPLVTIGDSARVNINDSVFWPIPVPKKKK